MSEDCTCTLHLYGMLDAPTYQALQGLLHDAQHMSTMQRRQDANHHKHALFVFYDVTMGRMDTKLHVFLHQHAIAYVWYSEPVYGNDARQILHWPLDGKTHEVGCLRGMPALDVESIDHPVAVAQLRDHAAKAQQVKAAAQRGFPVPQNAHERLSLLAQDTTLAQFANLLTAPAP